jgi:acyl-CoA synthetase (AMP-forming)/AMP-acid ligase II
MATLDPAGHLSLVRRKDSFINVGGRKVNPVRVQRIVADHRMVAEAVVYGGPTAGGEEEVWAAVVFGGGGAVDELLAYCRTRLASYEVPHRVHVLDRLPRNGMGKVDRGRLPRQP